jgi:hypothetical protein
VYLCISYSSYNKEKVFHLTKHYYNDHVKENEVSGASGKQGSNYMSTVFQDLLHPDMTLFTKIKIINAPPTPI